MAQPSTLAVPELVPLPGVIAAAPAGHEAAPGFEAWLAGARWTVTAVLERTAVIADPDDRWADRRVERIDALQVTPGAVLWQRKPDPELRRRRRPRPSADPAETPREAANELAPAPAGTVEADRPSEAPSAQQGEVVASAGAVPVAPEADGARDRERPEDVAEAERARCGRCRGELPAHNRAGICTACQRTCPRCDGPKALAAELCRACSRPAVHGPVAGALRLAGALDGLPAQVRDLLDQVVLLARYAQALEDELERHRTAARQVRRIGKHARAAALGGRGGTA